MQPLLLRACGVLAVAALLVPSHTLAARTIVTIRPAAPHGAPALGFEENRGQTDARVGFVARARDYTVFLEPTEAVFAFGGASEPIRLRLAGASSRATGSGADARAGTTSYFVSSDVARWRTKVPTYARVTYGGVYPGVDATYYGDPSGGLEYDFVVAPGADPSCIALAVEPAGSARVDASGDLVISTCAGKLRVRRPDAYQIVAGARREVACRYEPRADGTSGIGLGAYDRTAGLVIDPTVAYATFLGGSGLDSAYAAAKAADGSLYLAGYTTSINFPGAPVSPGQGGDEQVFVTKLNPTGTDIVSTTIVGGNGNDIPSYMKLDVAGNVYVRGITTSTDFPAINAAQPHPGGGQDLFVFRLGPDGNTLAYSTYLGGSGTEQCFIGFDVDAAGNAYVTGCTDGSDYPTKNALQPTYGGNMDGVLTKLSPSGQIVFSTYVGGGQQDAIYGSAVDATGAIHIVGATTSDDFPTKNALQPVRAGGADGVVMELTSAGDAIVYSTFFGGTGDDSPSRIIVDPVGNVYVAGETTSHDLPTTANVLQPTFGGGDEDGFIAKFSADGTSVGFSTYLGGTGRDRVFGLAVDGGGGLHLAGQTTSVDFPTKDPLQVANGGGAFDGFVAKMDSAGVALDYSTYLGGSGFETINSIAVDADGNTYVPLLTASADFPFVAGFQPTYGGGTGDGAEVTISDTYTLGWDAPKKDGQPPRSLTATLDRFASPGAKADVPESPRDVTGYNVYRSSSPNVEITPENLYSSVPPTQTSVPGAPGGSFFVVTAVFGTAESNGSNTAAAGAGPGATVTSVKVKPAKITAKGSGFTSAVQVFVDGIPFASAAVGKPTKSVQKGNLLTGESAASYLAAHGNRAVISFRNSDGGTTAFIYPP